MGWSGSSGGKGYACVLGWLVKDGDRWGARPHVVLFVCHGCVEYIIIYVHLYFHLYLIVNRIDAHQHAAVFDYSSDNY